MSGTGLVAEGVEFSDGAVALRWLSRWPSTVSQERGIEAIREVHGHGGLTEVRWVDGLTAEMIREATRDVEL